MNALAPDEEAIVELVAKFVDEQGPRRLHRLMIIGEGINGIQRNVIARQLVSRGGLKQE